jgi:hypothetical protein
MFQKYLSPFLVLALFLVACGSGETTSSLELVTNDLTEKKVEYVGEIPETDFFVAIAIGTTGDVLAYVCDGMGTEYLFRGAAQGNTLDLTSDEGSASLQANLETEGGTGTLTVGGQTYPFTTSLVKDYGGLYRVASLTEFNAEGISQGGATLKMDLASDKESVQVAVITTDGRTLSFDHSWPEGHDHREPTEYSESWLIFLNDGRGHGGHIKSSLQQGVRHFDPICPP